MDHFLSLSSLEDDTLARLLARARAAVRRPVGDELRGKVVGLVFQDPSLRTLASTQAAAAQLGGSSFVLQPGRGTWGLEIRDGVVMDGAAAEHVREAVPVLGSYADTLGVRAFAGLTDLAADLAEPTLSAFVRYAGRPVINLESAFDHPCQALADWQTLDHFGVPANGGRFVLSWAWHPKPLPQAVPSAVLAMAARRGMAVTVLRPEGFDLHPSVYARAAEEARRGGGSVTVTSDRAAALRGAHVLYAKSWAALPAWADPAADAALRAPLRADWCVEPGWFADAAPDARFMHCLPVRRNVVVADAVLDGLRSVVLTQAAHRLTAAKAVLLELLAPASALEPRGSGG